MNKEQIKQLALASGFKLKEQANGTLDLNPYVYEFAAALAVEAGRAGFIAGRSKGIESFKKIGVQYFELTDAQAADEYANRIKAGQS